MKYTLNSETIQQLQTVLKGVKNILSTEADLNSEKESILKMIEQVDSLVGKHDSYCDEIDAVLSAMINFDFSKRLPSHQEDDNNLIHAISQGLNILNEELYEKAINKTVVRSLLDSIASTKLIIVTDNKNNIIFANGKKLEGFKEDDLRGKPISTLFDHYELIIHLMKVESLSNNINMDMMWKGASLPVSLKIGISMNLNKIEGIIYVIDLS